MKYLQALKNINMHSDELTKPTKDPFVGSVSADREAFLKNEVSRDGENSDCDGRCRSCQPPCVPMTPAERHQGEQRPTPTRLRCHSCAKLAGCSKTADGNTSFAELCACDGTPPGRATPAQYPDEQGRVKCSCCLHASITRTSATCQRTRLSLAGIALLRECADFIGGRMNIHTDHERKSGKNAIGTHLDGDRHPCLSCKSSWIAGRGLACSDCCRRLRDWKTRALVAEKPIKVGEVMREIVDQMGPGDCAEADG